MFFSGKRRLVFILRDVVWMHIKETGKTLGIGIAVDFFDDGGEFETLPLLNKKLYKIAPSHLTRH